jgi:hypothetical protein
MAPGRIYAEAAAAVAAVATATRRHNIDNHQQTYNNTMIIEAALTTA